MFEQLFSQIDRTAGAEQWYIVVGVSLIAAITDLRSRRIPNWLTLPVFLAGLIKAGWTGGLSGLGEAVGACFLLAMPFVLLFLFAGGGAGDAKLMAAVGVWLGLAQGVIALVCVSAAGILLALGRAAMARRFLPVIKNIFITVYIFTISLLCGNFKPVVVKENVMKESDRLTVPYGTAIFAGVCAAWGVVWLC
jgi:prepilin peptidase CpaA